MAAFSILSVVTCPNVAESVRALHLSEKHSACVSKPKRTPVVDLRETTTDSAGNAQPGRGVSLTIGQVRKLKSSGKKLIEALETATKRLAGESVPPSAAGGASDMSSVLRHRPACRLGVCALPALGIGNAPCAFAFRALVSGDYRTSLCHRSPPLAVPELEPVHLSEMCHATAHTFMGKYVRLDIRDMYRSDKSDKTSPLRHTKQGGWLTSAAAAALPSSYCCLPTTHHGCC